MLLVFEVNHKAYQMSIDPQRRLLDILREDLELTGTKEGCGEGECGACTVLLNGKAAHACLVVAAQLQGKQVLTIEGLDQDGNFDLVQQAFVEENAIQCGFCTAGMVMATKALLLEKPRPTEAEIRIALAGNICRCSGYTQIVRAVQRASRQLEVKL